MSYITNEIKLQVRNSFSSNVLKIVSQICAVTAIACIGLIGITQYLTNGSIDLEEILQGSIGLIGSIFFIYLICVVLKVFVALDFVNMGKEGEEKNIMDRTMALPKKILMILLSPILIGALIYLIYFIGGVIIGLLEVGWKII